ncbi:hypothetical protein SAMN02799631_00318 [Methylobacterium sp. 174MFSha1.1]|uniref:hypothetical protein n=1 Tax=Methylobacterium sp. 174MFSha1.1 TaxID=1502749 RepID=UPI0008E2992A|nr:hypothetical protein [Methylobacterium sp. 174MFSha1.1]SFU35552.1 hypothetical protein SAMN02799631_00318 [Methylobacterium sp. 174MFSha1.1]
MAKRKQNPFQGDLFVADASVYTVAHDAIVGEVMEAIKDVLPPGVPTYVKEVRSAVRDALGSLSATLVLFDGQIQHLRISGHKGARRYSWPDLQVPFGWDDELKAWHRYPEGDAAAVDAVDQPEPDVALTPGERLVVAGIGDAHWVRLGGDLRDPDAPEKPRSLATPLFAKVLGSGEVRLFLNFPSASGLAFVQRVEAISGLKAAWDTEEIDSPFRYRGHHAEDLTTDAGWESLAATLEHTTADYVAMYAARAAIEGRLAIANARSLMDAAGVPEPESPGREAAIARLQVQASGQVMPVVEDAWAVIHAAEDGLIKPGGWANGYQIPATLTEAGRVRFGLAPKRQLKALQISSASRVRPNAR